MPGGNGRPGEGTSDGQGYYFQALFPDETDNGSRCDDFDGAGAAGFVPAGRGLPSFFLKADILCRGGRHRAKRCRRRWA